MVRCNGLVDTGCLWTSTDGGGFLVFLVLVAGHTLHFIGTFLRDEIITQVRKQLNAKYRARYEMKKRERERERKERMYREEI